MNADLVRLTSIRYFTYLTRDRISVPSAGPSRHHSGEIPDRSNLPLGLSQSIDIVLIPTYDVR